MIEGRWVKTVHVIFADDNFIRQNAEAIKKASGFCGLSHDDERLTYGKLKVRALYFASDYEAREFAEKHTKSVYVDGKLGEPTISTLKSEMPVFSDWYSNDDWRAWHKRKPDAKLDAVRVTMNDFNTINDAFDEAYEKNQINHKAILAELSLKNFAVWIDNYMMREFRYDDESDELRIDVFRNDDGGKNEIVASLRCMDLKTDDDAQSIDYALPYVEKDWLEDAAVQSAWEFIIVNWFIKTLPSHYSKMSAKVKPKQKTKNKKKAKTRPHEVVWHDEYEISLKGVTRKSLSHEIKCLCWGVRGHVRHYKDGREVFIKPYRKGKERNNPAAYEPKSYVKKENPNHETSEPCINMLEKEEPTWH